MEGDEEKKKWHKKKKKRSGGSRNRERWWEVNALGAPMQWTPELDRDLRRSGSVAERTRVVPCGLVTPRPSRERALRHVCFKCFGTPAWGSRAGAQEIAHAGPEARPLASGAGPGALGRKSAGEK